MADQDRRESGAPEAHASPPAHVAAAWPRSEEWPAADVHPSAWVRFYRDRLGWICRPTPGPLDVISLARKLHREAMDDYEARHGKAPPDDEQALMWDDSREIAEKSRKGPIGYTVAANLQVAADLSDERVDAWWGRPDGMMADGRTPDKERDRKAARGICVAAGRSSRAFPPVLVDVDVNHGTSQDGDLAGPWGEGLPGPKSRTPSGGTHTIVLGTGAERNSGGRSGLAPSVDVVAHGTTILVPAGSATPDRHWTSTACPVVAPEDLRRAPAWRPPGAAGGAGKMGDRGGAGGAGGSGRTGAPQDEGGSGRLTHYLTATAHDGEREGAAAVIVGMLARRGGWPADAVAAALGVLVDYAAALEWDGERATKEATRWRRHLTHGPRDLAFAQEFLERWSVVRNGEGGRGDRWRRPAYARMKARNFWRVADRRQEGEVGTEDHRDAAAGAGDVPEGRDAGGGPNASPTPAGNRTYTPPNGQNGRSSGSVSGPPAPPPVARQELRHDAGEVAPPESPPPMVGDDGEQRRRVHEAVLRRLLPTLGQAYTREQRLKDYARTPLRVDDLYPFADFVSGQLIRDGGPGHGMGRWFGRALGGLAVGDAKVTGAPGGKGGKTFFKGQMVEGLALCTAARIVGDKDYAHSPIVLPVWVSEMPKPGELWLRMCGRHCGFDIAAVAKGTEAEDERGIVAMANEHQMTSYDVVRRARELADFYDDHGDDTALGFALKHLVREIDLTALPQPRGKGRFREDPRTGPELMAWVADSMALYRRDLAALLGVPEDEVIPIAVLDPGQRFADEDSTSAKAALDSLLGAAVTRVCRLKSGLGGILLATSDTTKHAAREMDVETFLSGSGRKLAADIFAGSQTIMHLFDSVAVCGEEPVAGSLRTTQWARVLQGRTGAASECYPFDWEMHTGRFRPRPAQPLRAPPDEDRPRGGGGGASGTRGGARQPAPGVGDHPERPGQAAPGRPSNFRMPPRRRSYEGPDD